MYVCFSAADYHYELFSTYRFPINKGVAGYVTRTGKLLNITGAHDSEIFNPAVDEMTGYTTHTLLCAPLIVQGKYVCCKQSIYELSTCTCTGAANLIPRPCQVTERWDGAWEGGYTDT